MQTNNKRARFSTIKLSEFVHKVARLQTLYRYVKATKLQQSEA